MKRVSLPLAVGASLLLAGAVLWTLLAPGCSKSKSTGPENGAETNAAQASQPSTSPPVVFAPASSNSVAPVSSNSAAAGPAMVSEAAQQVAALRGQYRSAKAFDDRFELAVRLGETRTSEAVKVLEQLFREEPDKDLRVELINALMGFNHCKDERLRFLKLGLGSDQPAEVREAAIDGLVDLEDARALPLLQGLFNDPDQKISSLARQSHELAEGLLKSL
jgi:hypothetical protein